MIPGLRSMLLNLSHLLGRHPYAVRQDCAQRELFKKETRNHNMILQPYCFVGRRTYAQRSKAKYWKAKENAKAKTCMKNPDALNCAIRHRRCENCPFNKFFRSDKDTTKPT